MLTMENERTDVEMLSSTTSDEEEPALPKSNLLGLFDLCGESGTKCSSAVHVSQQQTQDPAMASSSSSVAAATTYLAPTSTTTTISQKQDDSAPDTQSVPNKEGCLSNNVYSPTSVDELPVLEHLEPTSATATTDSATATATAPASRQDEEEKEVIVSSAIVKAAMSVSTEAIATPPELSYVFSNLKDFPIHSLLALNLSQPCINRLAFYGIIHDINKEASDMSKEDGLLIHSHIFASDSAVALIDEEEWLLTAISSRTEEETQRTLRDQLSQSCTPSSGAAYRLGGSDNFAYACGEKDSKEPPTMTMATATNEYGDNPNPVVAMNSSSRTQLWKPSRSWWEARSSKNPWIDPQNHVKRWRYLWPLIHYHKFLAKCVKKLKRHGFSDFLDPNASPVAAFLRCEICAVSNHLAACSKFNSEQWLEALEHFSGWNDLSLEAHELVQALVSRQFHASTNTKITRLSSPLLRKVQESFVKSFSNNTSPSQPELLTMKEDAETMPAKMKSKGRKYYGAHSSAANHRHPDSLLWQGYQPAPYSQTVYEYYDPHMYNYYPEPPHAATMGIPKYPNSHRRGAAGAHRTRGLKNQSAVGGYTNINYPRYGAEPFGLSYYGSTVGLPYHHHPQDYGMYTVDYAGLSQQTSVPGSVGQPYDECSTVATVEEEPVVRTIVVTNSPIRNELPELSTMAEFRSPQPHQLHVSSGKHFLRSPPNSVPPSPFWNNFANQVVDYVCDSPFLPRSSVSSRRQQQHHRMTPCHHLGGALAHREEANVPLYNFYQFGGVAALPSPAASQFASTSSVPLFGGQGNNTDAPPAEVGTKNSATESEVLPSKE